MNERKMNEALLAAFPELKAEFEEYTSWQDGLNTGAFLTYEDIFLPHIVEAIEKCDDEFLGRTALFIEEKLTSGKDYSSNVICVGILEGLAAKCNHNKVERFLLEESAKEFRELEY